MGTRWHVSGLVQWRPQVKKSKGVQARLFDQLSHAALVQFRLAKLLCLSLNTPVPCSLTVTLHTDMPQDVMFIREEFEKPSALAGLLTRRSN